jgi:hypothetical protein
MRKVCTNGSSHVPPILTRDSDARYITDLTYVTDDITRTTYTSISHNIYSPCCERQPENPWLPPRDVSFSWELISFALACDLCRLYALRPSAAVARILIFSAFTRGPFQQFVKIGAKSLLLLRINAGGSGFLRFLFPTLSFFTRTQRLRIHIR